MHKTEKSPFKKQSTNSLLKRNNSEYTYSQRANLKAGIFSKLKTYKI